MAAAKELARYKLDLVGVQEVRWEKEGTLMGNEMKVISWELGFLYISEYSISS